jgi:hypothetical protein
MSSTIPADLLELKDRLHIFNPTTLIRQHLYRLEVVPIS